MPTVIDYILNYVYMVMLWTPLFGLVGNYLVYKIYSFRHFQKYSMSTYFLAISIVDSFTMLDCFLFYLKGQYGFDIEVQSSIFCIARNYLSFFISPISPWLMVAINVDRFLNIYFPKVKFNFV